MRRVISSSDRNHYAALWLLALLKGMGRGNLLGLMWEGILPALLDWARSNGYRTMILETTAQQAAAVALYQRCGFVEVRRSVWNEWELVWMRRSVER